jgi:Proteasomal ATPase OB C-terminal domain
VRRAQDTSTRQTIVLPVIGLVPSADLKPSCLVGVNKGSCLLQDKLPAACGSRVKAMEVLTLLFRTVAPLLTDSWIGTSVVYNALVDEEGT